jgi:hypothetical protein
MLFDGSSVESAQEFKPMPPGKYPAAIIDAEVGKTLAGHKKLGITLKVLSGPQQNRQVFENFLLEHTNPEAVKIGAQKLKQLIVAAGIGDKLEEVAQLQGAQVTINTKNEDKDGKTYTRVSWYETLKDAPASDDNIPL